MSGNFSDLASESRSQNATAGHDIVAAALLVLKQHQNKGYALLSFSSWITPAFRAARKGACLRCITTCLAKLKCFPFGVGREMLRPGMTGYPSSL